MSAINRFETPLIGDLNHLRRTLFLEKYNPNNTNANCVGYWFKHKIMTVVCVPADLSTLGLCTGGFALSLSTLVASKVAIYALSLGHIKPSYPTGCEQFVKWGFENGCEVFVITGELLVDSGDLIHKGYLGVSWVGRQIHLNGLFSKFFRELLRGADFCANRVKKGCVDASSHEPTWKVSAIPLLTELNRITKVHRIDYRKNERNWNDIIAHTALSCISIPANSIVATTALTVSAVTATVFTTKVVIYATTNVSIPVPTYSSQVFHISLSGAANAGQDFFDVIGDVFIIAYKVMVFTHLYHVLISARDVLSYIPEALFPRRSTNQF